MREPGHNPLKAWSREYNEPSFYFRQNAGNESRIIAWSEEPEMVMAAFYKILESMSGQVSLKARICGERNDDGKTTWTVYQGDINLSDALRTIRENEKYVFSDGLHQLGIKNTGSKRYLMIMVFFICTPQIRATMNYLVHWGFRKNPPT